MRRYLENNATRDFSERPGSWLQTRCQKAMQQSCKKSAWIGGKWMEKRCNSCGDATLKERVTKS
jgi:hypothetical protein